MSFLQPWLLAALPLVALPVIIHLINQYRYQSIRWGAMMFLLAAERLSRGYARLRQWLILLFRMLAIAALVFAISRPLASGWLGLAAGGSADTTLVLFDRSPSMSQGTATRAKLETGRQQLVRALRMLESGRRVLIDGATGEAQKFETPEDLLALAATEPTSASADIPALLQAAHEYIRLNKAGRTEVWLCSDLRVNDWRPEEPRWRTLRDAFLDFPQGVRFHLLAYPQTAPDNLSVRVTDVRRLPTPDGAELLLSLRLTRDAGDGERLTVPVQFEIEGARSELNVELEGARYELREHPIPLAASHERGWGRVSIPADANPADNDFYFVFDQPPPRQTLVVADDERAARPLELAASISPDATIACSAVVVSDDELPNWDWERVSLVLWQGPLPRGTTCAALERFVGRGGCIIFFPPAAAGDGAFMGVGWGGWAEAGAESEGFAVEQWRGDHDLLAQTQSGAALPVGRLQVRRYCQIGAGEITPLATVRGGEPLVARVATEKGGVYFCATTPAPGDSSLAIDGVVLYVAVQRALALGASALENTRRLIAGEAPADEAAQWQRLAGDQTALSTEYSVQRGVYAAGDRLLAVNRAEAEDRADVVQDDRIAALFQGLDFDRVDDQPGSLEALIREVWRPFLSAMMIALLAEAGLCLPRQRSPAGGRT
ncbi:MAG: BatA domain-containing protein [Planctomycetaceae bacterium]